MTKMVHDFSSLEYAPSCFRYTPVKFKSPFLEAWQDKPLSLEEALEQNPNFTTGVGLLLGEISGGVLAIDLDGVGSGRNFSKWFHYEVQQLPRSLAVTSGRPQRKTILFKVPKHYWKYVKYKKLKNIGCSDFELRWGYGKQSILVGKHPNELQDGQGFYSWLPGCSPQEVELAMAPEWFLSRWAEICKPDAPARKFKKETREQLKRDSARVEPFLQKYYQPPNKYSEYEDWLNVGMSLHWLSMQQGDEYLHLDDWLYWSMEMNNFKSENEIYYKWSSFSSERASTRKFGSFVRTAQKNNPDSFDDDIKAYGDAEEDDGKTSIDKIEETIRKLFELEKVASTDNWSERQFIRCRLGAYRIQKDEVDRKLFYMLAEEHDLRIFENDSGKRTARTLNSAPSKKEILEPLLPGFLLQGRDHLMVGESGSGKTLAALGLSYAVATGHQNLFDQEEGVDLAMCGCTLWIGTDGGEGAFGMLSKYARMLNPPKKEFWGQKFNFWGADTDKKKSPWAFTIKGLNELIEELEQGHPDGGSYRLVVIDSLKKVMELGNINYGIGCMGTVMQLIQSIASKYECCFVWLHHTAKNGNKEGITASGGNSNIFEIPYACHYLYKKERKGIGQVTRWVVEKYRGEKSRKFEYVWNKENGLFELLKPEELDDRTTAILWECWIRKDAGATTDDVVGGLQLERKTVQAQLTKTVKDKLIFNKKRLWHLTPNGAKKLAQEQPELQAEINEWIKRKVY